VTRDAFETTVHDGDCGVEAGVRQQQRPFVLREPRQYVGSLADHAGQAAADLPVAAIQLLVVVQPRRIAVLVGARLHRQWARRNPLPQVRTVRQRVQRVSYRGLFREWPGTAIAAAASSARRGVVTFRFNTGRSG
jgi:hypothetical protein